MSDTLKVFVNGSIFDGNTLRNDAAAVFRDGVFLECVPSSDAPTSSTVIDLAGDILSPGYTDLQVNGGGGVLLNDDPSVATLEQIVSAHRKLGVTSILPTLITDTAAKTQAAIKTAKAAVAKGVKGLAGLHLEGPHLSVARKGAHDASLIRPMEAEDLQLLLEASRALPVLKITLAPESVTLSQVRRLVQAGVLVSLGHSDADFDTCRQYFDAGARCATHLFNAMSQLEGRKPGLVGAVLASGDVSAGLIADGIHVHPATIQAAWSAKSGSGKIFLVSDAMAVAGTDQTSFHLGGRKIVRHAKRLTLEDGTLAGADLNLTEAIRVLHQDVGVPLVDALRAATSVPADLIGRPTTWVKDRTSLRDLIRIAADLSCVRMSVDASAV